MRKWKYHSLVLRDLSIAESKLNSEGEKGWELVSVTMTDPSTARAFFKIPIEEAEPAPVEPPAPVQELIAPPGEEPQPEGDTSDSAPF